MQLIALPALGKTFPVWNWKEHFRINYVNNFCCIAGKCLQLAMTIADLILISQVTGGSKGHRGRWSVWNFSLSTWKTFLSCEISQVPSGNCPMLSAWMHAVSSGWQSNRECDQVFCQQMSIPFAIKDFKTHLWLLAFPEGFLVLVFILKEKLKKSRSPDCWNPNGNVALYSS